MYIKNKAVHIGNEIKLIMREQGRSVTWMAKRLHTVRGNVYDIFERETLDVQLLVKISLLLRHNFVRTISEDVDKELSSEIGLTR